MTDKDQLKISLPDSIVSAEERRKRIREESDRVEAEQAREEVRRLAKQQANNEAARKSEDAFIEQVALVSSEETREHLYERIRAIRDEPAVNIEDKCRAPFVTERMRGQIELEQEAGRNAVARAQAQIDRTRDIRARNEAEQKAKEGFTTPVYVPNPRQEEVYPTNKR
jgi:hypothetical protein